MDLRNGDCLELLKSIPDKSVDLFICDLPYGETNCSWDSVIDLKEFWKEFKRVRKSKRTACIHFCSTKFGHSIIQSNPRMFKMDMVWKKRNKTGGLQSRYRPMRNHEMVYFFYEQAPKYNRDKYHKRIKTNFKKKHKEQEEKKKKEGGGVYKIEADMTDKERWELRKKNGTAPFTKHDPPNPSSVLEEQKDVWGQTQFKNGGDKGRLDKDGNYLGGYEPPNPPSVLEEQSNHQTAHLNEEAIKYNKDAFGNDLVRDRTTIGRYNPPVPASVIEEETVYSKKGWNSGDDGMGGKKFKNKLKENGEASYHEPLLPTSVIEEEQKSVYGMTKEQYKDSNKNGFLKDAFNPPNPSSVIEDTGNPVDGVYNKAFGGKGFGGKNFKYDRFDPPQPPSVIEEECAAKIKEAKKIPNKQREKKGWGQAQPSKYKKEHQVTDGTKFSPSQPGSVVVEEKTGHGWDLLSPEEKERIGFEAYMGAHFDPELPCSVYESSKIFIGKRNHQTEKPLDILSFFIKYYSDEGDTILDPTMGSGSTGVACKQLNRKFIGFEMNPTIFETAKKRVNEAVKIL